MFKKKVIIVATIIVMMVALAGCAKKPATPVVPQAGTSVSPEGHPAETPAQPGGKVKQADVETKINDLLKKNYPGDWKASGSTLSKGSYTENGNYKMADEVAALFPGTMGVSVFVGEERISSNITRQDTGERVLKDYPTPLTVGEVMKSGTTTSTLSSGYLKVYVPFKDSSAKTVAVMTVSVPQI
ncbi:MAG TPA: cache domain-containing protein [Desulfosporosinus sp.]|nr:cache domain-containing protein [Desulfosporosinus sp.]